MGRIYNRLPAGQIVQVSKYGPTKVLLTKHDSTLTEPIILAVDTSSKATSLAVARGSAVLRTIDELPDQKRSESLWSDVETLLVELGMTIRDIDVFGVCLGPGGFTGLRVGMAAVMGFAAAMDKPLVGVTSLEATAFAARTAPSVLAIVDAYKGEVYSQLFSFDSDGGPVAHNDPMVSTQEMALERVAEENDLVIACNLSEAVTTEIDRLAAQCRDGGCKFRQSRRGLAESVGQLTFLRYSRGEVQTAASLKAQYVRPSEAEVKLSLGLLGSKIKRSMKP